MFRSRMIPVAVLAAIAFGSAGAAYAGSDEKENGREIALAIGAKTSPVQAIAAAELQSGGRAMRFDIEETKGAYLYEVRTVSGEKVARVFVDPASGKVIRTDDEGPIARMFDREDGDDYAELARSTTTLAKAIAAAEQQTGGTAIEAKFEHEDGGALFEVEVAKDGIVRKAIVDGATGKVVKVRKAEHDD